MNIHSAYLPVLAAAAVEMGVSFAWYSDHLFGPMIRKITGKKSPNDMNRKIALHALAAIVKAAGLFFVISMFQKLDASVMVGIKDVFSMFLHDKTQPENCMMNALKSAAFVWFAFLMPAQATCTIWGSENWQKFIIVVSGQLACTLGMGATIALLS